MAVLYWIIPSEETKTINNDTVKRDKIVRALVRSSSLIFTIFDKVLFILRFLERKSGKSFILY